MIFLGYDPGGIGNNGVALVDFGQSPPTAQTSTCDCVDEALAWFQGNTNTTPTAIGIDTFMSWATGPSGWRPMDMHLVQTYPVVHNSVFSSNSARGAMAVQGMALAMRIRQVWPDIQINETHPKVLYYALAGQQYAFGQPMVAWLLNQFVPPINIGIANDHEWDALISAWATWMGTTGQWNVDLMHGVPNLLLPAGAATYFWP